MTIMSIAAVGCPSAVMDPPPPPVIPIPSPNYNDRPPGAAIDTVVLHHTAGRGTAQDVARWFQDPAVRVSSHYVVGKDGVIVESVPEAARAWHAGRSEFSGRPNVNDFSVGIEIANLGDGVDPYPPAQYEAVVRLVAHLVGTYRIPLDRITRHRDVALPPGRKTDTSDNFDTDFVRWAVAEVLAGRPIPPPPVQDSAPRRPQPSLPDWQYRVRPGDTLYGIARTELGDPRRWPELQAMNTGRVGPNGLIRVGQILNIPLDDGGAAERPR